MLRGTMTFHVKLMLVFAASLLMVFGSCARFYVFGADESEAVAAIVAAEKELVLCYNAVAEAERSGANVSALLATLDAAGELLSRAELSYRVGDFDSAVDFASQSQDKLNGFDVEAEALTEMAVQEHYWDFLANVVGSLVGTVAVVCGSFVVWLLLKKRQGGGGGE